MSEQRGKKQIQIPKKPSAAQWVTQGRERVSGTQDGIKRLTLDLPASLHRAIKLRATERDMTMVDMLRELLEEHYGVGQSL